MANNQSGLMYNKEFTYGHWVVPYDFDCKNFYGFTYVITNLLTNKKYIGKKNFKISGHYTRDWKQYTGSQKELSADIRQFGKGHFSFTIISLYTTPELLNNAEHCEQVAASVLTAKLPNNQPAYYNRCIHNIKFNNTGNICSLSVRKKISSANKGQNAGQNSTNADTAIYYFRNAAGVTFTGTQYAFKQYSKLSDASVSGLVHNNCQVSKGWFLIDQYGTVLNPKNNNKGKNCYRYDSTLYTIHHVANNELFVGTRSEISEKTGAKYSFTNAFVTGNKKSMYGWYLVCNNKGIINGK